MREVPNVGWIELPAKGVARGRRGQERRGSVGYKAAEAQSAMPSSQRGQIPRRIVWSQASEELEAVVNGGVELAESNAVGVVRDDARRVHQFAKRSAVTE